MKSMLVSLFDFSRVEPMIKWMVEGKCVNFVHKIDTHMRQAYVAIYIFMLLLGCHTHFSMASLDCKKKEAPYDATSLCSPHALV